MKKTKKFILSIAVLTLITINCHAQELTGINKTDTLLKDTVIGQGNKAQEDLGMIKKDTITKDTLTLKESKVEDQLLILETDTSFKDTIVGNKGYLKGRIIKEVSLTPVCDKEAFGTVVEFEIIYFSDVMYTQKNVGVIFTCPEMYKEHFFEVGKTYEINLSDRKQTSAEYTIPNKKLLEKYKLNSELWSVSAKKLD